ncbi:PQQ-dependent dehydrogenase, methanol/ethanol family [Jiella sp. M17.18]|uniref:PQQ-dependent dehydrogenase, methanol/ethanol family n=1 Tax=Jiella sp. M17.18 TaxID=3234247 RepID=UPI0034DF5B29
MLLPTGALAQGGGSSGQAASGTDLQSLSRDPAQWVMPAKNYAGTRYSELDQINADNVGKLQLAWTFSNGVDRGQESIPLVVGNTMYIVGPWPNNLFALNATTGDLKWVYSPPTARAAQGVACCDVVNRGAAYDNGKIFYNTLDNHAVAVDAKTGKEVWHTELGDINTGMTMTMAPLVAKGKVFVGSSGGELGVRGWLTALDENTGKIAWRAWSTGSDKDVLIGKDFKPPYDWMKGKDLGIKTWPADRWKTGGGNVWGWISYDPESNLIYYGTGNPGPWNPNQRKGDNLWTTTIFARDADTGMAKWAYQTSPHDLWDHDSINEVVLLDLKIDGQMRKVMIRPGRTGYMYVMDRTTGKLISATPFDTVTAYKGVDMQTGRIIPNEKLKPDLGKTVKDICPAPPGAKDWQPTAWSPKTHLLYVPHQHLCMNFKASEVGYIAGTPYLGATVDMYAGPGDGYRGEFMAWDPVKKKKVWAIHENFPVWSGTVVTAGNIAFYGTMDRWFKAVNATTGDVLWQFRAPSGFIGQPSVYKGSDGREYVAILSGVGGWSGAVADAELDPRVRNGALGFVGATQDLPAYTKGGSTLLVFALPGGGNGTRLPPSGTPGNLGRPIQNPPPAHDAGSDQSGNGAAEGSPQPASGGGSAQDAIPGLVPAQNSPGSGAETTHAPGR